MSRRVPLNSVEGRALVNRGPAWREHPDYYADEPADEEPTCDSCGSTGPLTFSAPHAAHFCPTCAAREMPTAHPDEFAPIPWFTDSHAREAAERMKAWAQGQADTLGDARWCDLTDGEWLNLARVCFEPRPR